MEGRSQRIVLTVFKQTSVRKNYDYSQEIFWTKKARLGHLGVTHIKKQKVNFCQ